MKYVCFETPTEETVMVLFDDTRNHADIANAMKHFNPAILTPVSAGFANAATCTCSGRSTSLKLESREIDDYWLKQTLKRF